MTRRPQTTTLRTIRHIFDRLDYETLGPIYCHEGGTEFWRAQRDSCRRLGLQVAQALLPRLSQGGRSLYVGAGVAELPALLVETLDLERQVHAYNLRRVEVASLNRTCRGMPVRFHAQDAAVAKGLYDHLWLVSVLNDPERFPHLGRLSYGRADPLTFDPQKFHTERRIAQALVDRCLEKMSLPALVTTSTEEVVWIADWCHRNEIPYLVDRRQYPTALVGDPICFIRLGVNRRKSDHIRQGWVGEKRALSTSC